jgi:hypothetical protein
MRIMSLPVATSVALTSSTNSLGLEFTTEIVNVESLGKLLHAEV